ncbi:fumarylacetoacetate hydrolase family protein [Schaalia sp. 19OD2882]|uniref:fumarylacetoacetate hydrolase family protein n=1 Tax=Schaalia sp. 19OD2882 TaxID=2794089 RepID=UPI001C1EDB2E|nr:fumarylacetoacetate hydrolase family protein [Schaalia sp. 19OD2882]QWW19091.1 fumarylacetoacetate hydrolase family protein [Schaalia sp. 19OD2882]
MRIVRFSDGGSPLYGALEDDSARIVGLKGDPLFSPVEPSGRLFDLEEVRLLSPVIPRSKIVGIGKNYAEHAREMGGEPPTEPVVFLKPNTSVIGPDDPIVLPEWSGEVHHEAELAIVIKTLAKDVPLERVDEVILGWTCANDVTARDRQRADGQWTRAKGFDTSCPIGPWITVDPRLDVDDLQVTCRVDGRLRQDDRTSSMLMSPRQLVSYVSSIFTLLPGDVIITGTPAGVGPIEAGQRVDVEVEGIGVLSNPVVRR